MRFRHLITTTTAVLAVGLAGPVMAQQAGPGPGNQAQGGSAAAGGDQQSGAGNQASGGSTAVGGDQSNGNAHNDTQATGGNAASRGGILVSGNTLTVNRSSTRNSTRTNTESDSNSGANGLSASRGATVDTSATGNGSYAASRGGRNVVGNTRTSTRTNTETDTTSGAGGVSASRGASVGAVAMGASYAANDGGEISNGNTSIVATQDLDSTVSGNMLTGGVPEGGTPGSPFNGGFNSVSGSSFAAFAGILNQGWNTGFASNVQSAGNIAAQGTVTFTGGANGRASP